MEDQHYMLGAILRVPFQAIVDDIYSALVKAGYSDLRPPHFVVFQQMKTDGVRAGDLAEKAQITKQSMSYLVRYLQDHGYVAKFADPSDGRAHLLRLTERGRDVERVARETIDATRAKWSRIVGENRMQELLATLRRLVAYIESERDE